MIYGPLQQSIPDVLRFNVGVGGKQIRGRQHSLVSKWIRIRYSSFGRAAASERQAYANGAHRNGYAMASLRNGAPSLRKPHIDLALLCSSANLEAASRYPCDAGGVLRRGFYRVRTVGPRVHAWHPIYCSALLESMCMYVCASLLQGLRDKWYTLSTDATLRHCSRGWFCRARVASVGGTSCSCIYLMACSRAHVLICFLRNTHTCSAYTLAWPCTVRSIACTVRSCALLLAVQLLTY